MLAAVRGIGWRRRCVAQAAWDAVSCIICLAVALVLRHDLSTLPSAMSLAALAGAGAAILDLVLRGTFHLYQARYATRSPGKVLVVALLALGVGSLATLLLFLAPPTGFPRSTFVVASGIAAAGTVGARFVRREARLAAAIGKSGETLVLNMAVPVAMVAVARQMIHCAGRNIDLAFSGVRPGEKLTGTLTESLSEYQMPHRLLVAHVGADPLDWSRGPALIHPNANGPVMALA